MHGLAQHDLVHLLANWPPAHSAPTNVIHVVACSETQCADHVQEIQARWDVEARPWCLSQPGEPPSGSIIAPYFHHNEVRRRWPHRLHEVRFAAIHPDPQLPRDPRARSPASKRVTLTLCEFDEPMVLNMAANLSVLFLADRYRIKTRGVRSACSLVPCRGSCAGADPRPSEPGIHGAQNRQGL